MQSLLHSRRSFLSCRIAAAVALVAALSACGGGGSGTADAIGSDPAEEQVRATAAAVVTTPSGPAAGYSAGRCPVPTPAQAVDTSRPTRVVGTGTPASCTSDAVVNAVAQGGIIKFNCGAKPVTIAMSRTAKVFNNKPDVVLDGEGKVTLSGGGRVRVLYQNTCDPKQVWTSPRCDIQDTPRLTVQNLTFVDGNSAGQSYGESSVYGGGAIYVRGGRLKIVNSRFFRNECEATGPDVGGGAVRVFGNSPQAPVYVTKSSFGGAPGYGNSCSNGGGLSGLHASFSIHNSLFSHNRAIGYGANPKRSGTPGGGSGGAIYQDGNTIRLGMCGNHLRNNTHNEGGGAMFFVSNNRTGTMSITDSLIEAHLKGRFETAGLPGIFILAKTGQPVIVRSTLRR
ncbi:hypothetical protein [Methylibium sp.]|uniref:hypothetical protein n=1 Tax=Methylibium sp. TaxID=2067992 RepID=UPI0025FA6190|nr:hypothetical protein [Methylibium sp.]